ncbi:MAG: hypothetical protein JXC85_06610 [Candidatus Aenigmarchaeota archaeon]|nr:hypothetical protein [Candidatus Aenigmarchaeota archaeon]
MLLGDLRTLDWKMGPQEVGGRLSGCYAATHGSYDLGNPQVYTDFIRVDPSQSAEGNQAKGTAIFAVLGNKGASIELKGKSTILSPGDVFLVHEDYKIRSVGGCHPPNNDSETAFLVRYASEEKGDKGIESFGDTIIDAVRLRKLSWMKNPNDYFKTQDGVLFGYGKTKVPGFMLGVDGIGVDFYWVDPIFEEHLHESGVENCVCMSGGIGVLETRESLAKDKKAAEISPGTPFRVDANMLHRISCTDELNPIFLFTVSNKAPGDYHSFELDGLVHIGALSLRPVPDHD